MRIHTGERNRMFPGGGAWMTALFLAGMTATAVVSADDWPEFRGLGRRGVWNETGIVERLPEGGLKVLWRAPVKAGYSGPAVARGRVFVTDFTRSAGSRGTERIQCFDEKTGQLLWKQEWEVTYGSIGFENGPMATPTVDGDRVYALGTSGILTALDASGQVMWRKDYVKDYGADLGSFGFSNAPIVDGDRLIAMVGGPPDSRVIAFDKMTGKEIWRALRMTSPLGGSQPIIIEAGGTRQLIIWHATAVVSLNPVTGATYWEQPHSSSTEMNIAMVHAGPRLFMTTFYEGPLMLGLDEREPGPPRVMWKGNSTSEISTDKLHSTIAFPIVDGDYIYGICSYGQLRALDARTGERIWETQAVTVERARWASAQIVRHGDRVFITNDRGELIIARLTPKGYEEISRAELLKPTTNPRGRRKLGAVNMSAAAYANKHIYLRNDEELIAVSLAQDDYR